MLAPVRKQRQDLHRPVLDGRGQVFDRHRRQGRLPEPGAQVLAGPGRIADFKAGDRGDPDQAAFNPPGPFGGVRADGKASKRRLVDQPCSHRQACDITSGSARSPKTSANRAKS